MIGCIKILAEAFFRSIRRLTEKSNLPVRRATSLAHVAASRAFRPPVTFTQGSLSFTRELPPEYGTAARRGSEWAQPSAYYTIAPLFRRVLR
jgi:hypothetical protein